MNQNYRDLKTWKSIKENEHDQLLSQSDNIIRFKRVELSKHDTDSSSSSSESTESNEVI